MIRNYLNLSSNKKILTAQEDKPHDKCGVFGIYDPKADIARITYYALYGLQHRGQESAGIAVSNGKRFKLRRGMGLVRDVFKTEKHIERLGNGILAVGHNRYSTTGSSQICNAQPFLLEKNGRQIVIAHNGNLINSLELKEKVKEMELTSTTDTEIVAALLLESRKEIWEERFSEILPLLKGAYSFVIATRDLLFGIRDPYGVRPLMLGEINHGFVLSSEDCIFSGIGAKLIREIKAGEGIIIDKNGPKTFYHQGTKNKASCIFEYIYLARPDSTFNKQSIGKTREYCGKALALKAPVNADMVMAIPDSGTAAAIGFASTSGIPFGEGVIQNRYIGRTFIQPDQRMRDLGIKIKFGPMRVNLKKKRVVVIDDSIVRGSTLRDFVKLLRINGAKKVHLRIACPPIIGSCFYGVDTPTRKELIASQFTKNGQTKIKKICKYLGADSLAYLTIEDLLRSVGVKNIKSDYNPQKAPFCTACLTGKYKIPLMGNESKFQLENPCYPSELVENPFKKIAVLISNKGTGTNFQAIVDAIERGEISGKISIVVSDVKDAFGLIRAKRHGIPIAIISNNNELLKIFEEKYKVDFIALAGWKQIVPNNFINKFQNRILNLHPGLIPDKINDVIKNPDGTPGLWNRGKFTEKAISNFLDKKMSFAGSSINFLTKEFDFGPVLSRCFEKIKPNDTIESLYKRLKQKENKMYVTVLAKLCKQ